MLATIIKISWSRNGTCRLEGGWRGWSLNLIEVMHSADELVGFPVMASFAKLSANLNSIKTGLNSYAMNDKMNKSYCN